MTEAKVAIISVGIILLSLIIALTSYAINDRNLMAKNIETAISKGIDPLSVRCSYVKSDDIICVTYAASHGNLNITSSNNTISKR